MSHSLLQRQSCHAALLFVATFQFVIHVYNLYKIKSTCLSVTNFNSSVNYLRKSIIRGMIEISMHGIQANA